jgi:hypothetical protein
VRHCILIDRAGPVIPFPAKVTGLPLLSPPASEQTLRIRTTRDLKGRADAAAGAPFPEDLKIPSRL